MRKIIIVFMLVLASSILMLAQENNNKADIFGGYQWTSVGFGSGASRQNFNGFDGAVTGYFNKNFGITADFSGAFKKYDVPDFGNADFKLYSYMFGPTVRVPMDKVTPFVHALFGAAHGTISASASGVTGSISDNSFAYAFGGGLDVNASKNVAIRIGQFDYYGTRFNLSDLGVADHQNNFRYSAGIVFKF